MSRKPSGRHIGLVRCLTLVRLLEQREWTLLQLADHFGVSTRTVRRDFACLEQAGYLCETRRGWDCGEWFDKRGHWRLAKRTAA